MPEQDDRGRKVQESLEIAGVELVAGNESAEVEEPREEALDLPASAIAAKLATVLRRHIPSRSMGRDELETALLHQTFVLNALELHLQQKGHFPRLAPGRFEPLPWVVRQRQLWHLGQIGRQIELPSVARRDSGEGFQRKRAWAAPEARRRTTIQVAASERGG
jgi:hypothetical protein